SVPLCSRNQFDANKRLQDLRRKIQKDFSIYNPFLEQNSRNYTLGFWKYNMNEEDAREIISLLKRWIKRQKRRPASMPIQRASLINLTNAAMAGKEVVEKLSYLRGRLIGSSRVISTASNEQVRQILKQSAKKHLFEINSILESSRSFPAGQALYE